MSILDRSILVDSICGVVIRKGATVITVMAETVPAAKGTAVQIQFRSYFGYNTHTHVLYMYPGWWFGACFYFSIYWEESSQLTFIFFQRGRYTTNQYIYTY